MQIAERIHFVIRQEWVCMQLHYQENKEEGIIRNSTVDKGTSTGIGSVLPSYLLETRVGDKKIKDGQETLPNNKIYLGPW